MYFLNKRADCRHQRCDGIEKGLNVAEHRDDFVDLLNAASNLVVDGLQFLGGVLELLCSVVKRCLGQLPLAIIQKNSQVIQLMAIRIVRQQAAAGNIYVSYYITDYFYYIKASHRFGL